MYDAYVYYHQKLNDQFTLYEQNGNKPKCVTHLRFTFIGLTTFPGGRWLKMIN